MRLILIRAAFDSDAKVWFVQSSDLAGVHAEGTTLDELRDKLPAVVQDVRQRRTWRCADRNCSAYVGPDRPARGGVKGFGKEVRDMLTAAGCAFLRHGKGDHDIWTTPSGQRIVVPVKIMSGTPLTRYSKMLDSRKPSRRIAYNFENCSSRPRDLSIILKFLQPRRWRIFWRKRL